MSAALDTHEVLNQTPPFQDANLVALDRPLLDALRANGVDPDAENLPGFGAEWGAAERIDLGRLANENPPKLNTHDPRGERAGGVEFHPTYHALMQAGMAAGLHNSTWDGGGHVARAARLYTVAQVEAGHVCPLTMTHASVAALSAAPARLREVVTAHPLPNLRPPVRS